MVLGLCDRMRRTNALFEDHSLAAGKRVAACLVRLARDRGEPAADGTIELAVTQRDLMTYLGITLAAASRALTELRVANLIETTGARIQILSLPGLSAIADER